MNTHALVIAGAGPVGLSLALALTRFGLNVHLVDPKSTSAALEDTQDIRGTALSQSSVHLLQNLGLWDSLAPDTSPITTIEIQNGTHPFVLNFLNPGANEPLGYIVEGFRLRQHLLKAALAQDHITFHQATIQTMTIPPAGLAQILLSNGVSLKTPLVLAADGKNSGLRTLSHIAVHQHAYHTALVCSVHHSNPHHGVAYEKFYPLGPFATLPMTENRSSIVWCGPDETIKTLQHLEPSVFLACLQQRLGPSYQDLQLASPRVVYPLTLQIAESYIGPRLALVGDAAHVIHPLAGQGLNLGLRDVGVLAEVLQKAISAGQDVGSLHVLKAYEQGRLVDMASLVAVTHGLNAIFSNTSLTLRSLRHIGLRLFNKIPGLKALGRRHAMGLLGDLPPLLKGKRDNHP